VPKLVELTNAIAEKSEQVQALYDEEDAGADHRETISGLNREIEELEKRALDAKAHEERRAENDRRLERYTRPVTGIALPNGRADADGPPPGRAGAKAIEEAVRITLGQRFVESAEWTGYLKSVAPNGQVSPSTAITSPKLVVPGGIKTLITGAGATSGGAFTVAQDSGIYEPLGRRTPSLRDIVTVRTTTSDAVEFVKMLTRVDAAAVVAEATATAGASGTKPEGGMTFERVTAVVRTIAEWVPATKRAIADAGQLRGIIDDELRADVADELNDEMLNGDGTGEHLVGLANTSGTQTQAWDTNLLTTTRKARTKVRVPGRSQATAYVLNPTDWEALDLLQDNEARYYFGGPMVLGTPRLWGLPVVEEEAQAAGAGWVGDFRKAVLWDRQETMVSVSDSHADFFIRNMVAVLAELRATFGVTRPAAFVEMDLTA